MKLLTPPGIAGIAVVLADPAERTALLALLRAPGGGALLLRAGAPPRRALLQIGGVAIDDVLVVDRGLQGIEVHVHGAPAVLDVLRQTFAMASAVPSGPAEQLLWEAMAPEQMDLAVEQMACDLQQFCRELLLAPPTERADKLVAARWRSRVARAHLEAPRLVLVGAQNAGKSSLFNLLLFRERVLTGPQPGLTRDPVVERTTLDGYPYEVVDTAGEGPVSSPTDERALAMAREHRAGALLLLVVDCSVGPSASDLALAAQATLVVANKSDLAPAPAPWPTGLPCHLQLSCAGGDASMVRRRVGCHLRESRGLPPAGRVGGVAALTAAQERLLDEVEGASAVDRRDCSPSH